MQSIVIIGYGQLGASVNHQHLKNNDHVISASRTSHTALSPNHHHIVADLDALNTSLDLPAVIDTLYYFAPPADTDLNDIRLENFLRRHKHIVINHIVYISTSGVYGTSHGNWITESTPVNPVADRAKRRLAAENCLQQYHLETAKPVTILRCAAIYSSKTVNKQRIQANNKPVIKPEQAPFTNRIHIDDLTEVCLIAASSVPASLEIYNVSDGHPTTTTEHAWLLADMAGVDRNRTIDISEADQYYSAAYLSYLNESKKLDITKLKRHLKPKFNYLDIRKGIQQCLDKEES